ncbi:MAG TPA: hypothetical protein VND93_28785 [Myxococcales bacterium]|nr:hypothetical protein [Myxococcales bacterium]
MTMRSWRVYRALVPGVVVLLAGVVSGCGNRAEDATASVAEAVEPASSATDSPEIAGLLDGLLGGPDRDTLEGFHCDASPDISSVTVCDKQFPSGIHLDWTACKLQLPPPPDGQAPATTTSGAFPFRPPPPDVTSAGNVDVSLSVTLDPSTTCGDGAKFQLQESTTFQVQRSGSDGRSMSASGTSTSTAELGASGPETKTTQLDVTRGFSDGSGEERSVHLAGSLTVAFDRSSGALVRTINGDLQATFSDENTSTVQLVDLVRPSPDVCRWPTSGSVIRTDADGTVHTLVYGPACGQATLDGQPITPHEGPGGGGGMCGGSQPPPGGMPVFH